MGHKTSNPLVTFLYLLARDSLPTGKITRLIDGASNPVVQHLSGPELARLAERWARELRTGQEPFGGMSPEFLAINLKAARDEIERLTAKVDRLKEKSKKVIDEGKRLVGLSKGQEGKIAKLNKEIRGSKIIIGEWKELYNEATTLLRDQEYINDGLKEEIRQIKGNPGTEASTKYSHFSWCARVGERLELGGFCPVCKHPGNDEPKKGNQDGSA